MVQIDLFISGEGGYHTYRIPSIIVTPGGAVLAFCEGRKHGRGDSGDIDIVMRRSPDGGETWEPMRVIADFGSDTIGNPCPVVDRETGVIWLLLTHNLGDDTEREIMEGTSRGTRTVWVMRSEDEGETWSEPVEITASVKPPNWTWYATGPGVGIQLRYGEHRGRLIIPCDHALAGSKVYRSHVIYSDDHGESWRLGGAVGDHVNECQVVELVDGRLLLNMRSYHGRNRRAVAFSADGGLTWSEPTLDPTLIEPVCQASILRFTDRIEGDRNRILFSNPASTRRERMTVRLSYDEGRSWPISKVIHEGPSAYSCLAVFPDMTIGCLYERGRLHPYERITLARFTLEWLTDGADSIRR